MYPYAGYGGYAQLGGRPLGLTPVRSIKNCPAAPMDLRRSLRDARFVAIPDRGRSDSMPKAEVPALIAGLDMAGRAPAFQRDA